MVTSGNEFAVLIALRADDWPTVLQGIDDAGRWLRNAVPGEDRIPLVVERLVGLAGHRKWEIRRAIANVAARTDHPLFEPVLARFVSDDNALVREAARRAALRRRDWQNAGAFGKQHEARINATLDDIESRFGVRGREAVKRASEQIADTFARELYHEVIKVLAPVASSAERLKARLSDSTISREQLADDARTIGRRVTHLKSVLDAMRAYTAKPSLEFAAADITEIVTEALTVVREGEAEALLPSAAIGSAGTAEVCRARLVQALMNVLVNAVESYDNTSRKQPVRVVLEHGDGWIAITVEDCGCGMSNEVLADATVLFTTSKPQGTGFGLPLAMKIIESEHGGRLTITSEKGSGTIVRMTIPMCRPGDQR
jgi:signal transduction histidine kinase